MTAALLAVGSNAFAADYSRYTTEELIQMRPSIEAANAEEQKAFAKEWEKRLKAMTPEERQRVEESAAAGAAPQTLSDAQQQQPGTSPEMQQPGTPAAAPQGDPMDNQQVNPQENQQVSPEGPEAAPQDNQKSATQKKSKKKTDQKAPLKK